MLSYSCFGSNDDDKDGVVTLLLIALETIHRENEKLISINIQFKIYESFIFKPKGPNKIFEVRRHLRLDTKPRAGLMVKFH